MYIDRREAKRLLMLVAHPQIIEKVLNFHSFILTARIIKIIKEKRTQLIRLV